MALAGPTAFWLASGHREARPLILCTERLKKLKLPCLKYRRIRGDLIEVYKIITGSYDEHILKNILKTKEASGVRHSRRGHNFMLKTQTYQTKYRKKLL